MAFQGFELFSVRVNYIRVSFGCILFWLFQGVECFRAQGLLGFFKVQQVLGFFIVQRSFAVRVYLRVSQGCEGFRLFQGIEWFRAQGLVGLLTVGQGLAFFRVQRSFAVRVYLRVSYGCVGFRFFRVNCCFALRVAWGCLRLDRLQGFPGFRGFLQLGYILGLVRALGGLEGFALWVGQGCLRFFTLEFWIFLQGGRFFHWVKGFAFGCIVLLQGIGVWVRVGVCYLFSFLYQGFFK